MTTMRRLLAAASIVAALAAPAAATDDYPSRPVRVVIPFDPGGINETGARIVATQLSERLGKQFLMEFKPGAGGMVGTEYASRAAPDGYTIAVISVANAVHPALYSLTYDLRKAFEPVAMLLSSPNTLAVHPSLPANTLREFIALAKSKPGDIQYASRGVGGSLHLGMELFRMQAGLEMLHVPFRGAGPAAIDVVAGNTKAVMSSTSTLSPHVRSGKLRGLGISSRHAPAVGAGGADLRRGRLPAIRGRQLDRLRRARRHAQIHHREAAKGNRRNPRPARRAEAVREPRRDRREDDRGRVRRLYRRTSFAKWGKVVKDAKVKAE